MLMYLQKDALKLNFITKKNKLEVFFRSYHLYYCYWLGKSATCTLKKFSSLKKPVVVTKCLLICMGFISLHVYWLQKNNKKVIKEIVVLKGPHYTFISEKLDQAIFFKTVDSFYL